MSKNGHNNFSKTSYFDQTHSKAFRTKQQRNSVAYIDIKLCEK